MAFENFLRNMTRTSWVTSRRTRLRVVHMETAHLENAIAYCLRWAMRDALEEELDLLHVAAICHGEFAQDACYEAANAATRRSPEEYCLKRVPPFQAMLRELQRRRAEETAVGQALALDDASEAGAVLALAA